MQMGEKSEFIIHTGSPSIDEIIKKEITKKNKLEEKYRIKIRGDEILLLQHPVTTEIDETEMQITETLNAIIKLKKKTIIIGSNLDPGNKIIYKKVIKVAKKYEFIEFYPTLPRNDYIGFLKNCGVLVGNSSSGIIEASFFNIPVVNIGIRQQDREKGENIFDVPNSTVNSILRAIKNALESSKRQRIKGTIYGDGNASKKIVKQLERIKINDELIQKQIFY